MQLEKIRKRCMEMGTANLMHTAQGDYINCGGAFYWLDGMTLTTDMLTALFGMTAKQKSQMNMQEFTHEQIGLTDDEVSIYSDEHDIPLVRMEGLQITGDTVRILRPVNDDAARVYLSEGELKAMEKKDGIELLLRKAKTGDLAVACEGMLVTGFTWADMGNGLRARDARKRILRLADVTADVKLEEEEHDS